MEPFHGTTILSVRRGSSVALGGDGQVTLGSVVVKATARKVRRLYGDRVLAGFAGATADAFTLFERFEAKLDKHQGQLQRAAVELAKDWRSDRVLRRLEALLVVADKEHGYVISGSGELIEPDDGILAIGSGAAPARGDACGSRCRVLAGDIRQRRRPRARARHRRDRLRRRLRAGCRPGTPRAHRPRRRRHRQTSTGDRRRHLHIYQPASRHLNAGMSEPGEAKPSRARSARRRAIDGRPTLARSAMHGARKEAEG